MGIKFLMEDGSIVDPTMTAHLDTQPVGGVAHKALKKDTPADGAGEAVNVSNAATGYKNFRDSLGIPPGNTTLGWAFQLTGVAKILATQWTYYFRSYVSGGTAHGNLGAQIRKNADNTLRQEIIAVDVSGNTANFPAAYGTVSGTYNLAEYTVVDQTDWLVCYWYAHVTVLTSGKKSYLRYDDIALAVVDQVRIINVSFEAPAIIETITAKSFPMLYLSKPVKAQELMSKVEGATVTKVAKDFPEELLKRKVQATFGKTTIGGIDLYVDNYEIAGSKVTLSANGDVESITLYCRAGSGTINMKLGIYDDNAGPNNLKGVTNEVMGITTTWAWIIFSFASPLSLTAGTYWLEFMQNNEAMVKYDSVTGEGSDLAGQTYPNFPDPLTGETINDWEISIYATYTIDGKAKELRSKWL